MKSLAIIVCNNNSNKYIDIDRWIKCNISEAKLSIIYKL